MENLINILLDTAQSHSFLFIVISVSFMVKLGVVGILFPMGTKARTNYLSWLFLMGTIIGASFGDIAWLVKSGKILFFPEVSYSYVALFIRLAWAFLIIQYQALALFVYNLTNHTLGYFDKACIGVSAFFTSYFLFIAFFQRNYLCTEATRELAQSQGGHFEFQCMQIVIVYIFLALVLPSLYIILRKIRSGTLPKILTKQIKIFTTFFILPFFCTEFILGICFKTIDTPSWRPLVAVSTILLMTAICYCLKQIMGLRFLNRSSHVEAKPNLSMIEDFKTVLEQLSNTNSLHELSHITQLFFKEAFQLPARTISFILREKHQDVSECTEIHHTIELFLSSLEDSVRSYLYDHGLLCYDELSFDQFHEKKTSIKSIIHFLNTLNADIFLPIFIKNKIVGAVVIERNAREQCFSKAECDAMLVFANYVSNMISLLQHKNLDMMVHKEKQLQEELYHRHQEINQYKESINAFLRKTKQKSIGLIFFKNKMFTFGNQAAKELIKININTQEGHPLTKAFNRVAAQVENFKAPYTHFARDEQGHMIILSGVPHLQHNHVIITVMYPDISDVIAKQIDHLDDPNNWDYVLYLESTAAGAHINELIPSSGPTMLNFKIELLKAALSKRALLLDMPDEDVDAIVERLHHISLRETLHTIELNTPLNNDTLAAKLFGMNPLVSSNHLPALLKTLHTNGTLFIKNIHLLDLDLQEQIADFITYGYYRLHKSEQREYSAARIMCSTNQNIYHLVQNGSFSPKLFEALKPIITLPSLSTMQTDELHHLIDGYTDMALQTHTFKNMLALTDKEKERLIHVRPTSLHELKLKVQQQLMKKSKESNIQAEIIFDPAYKISDPELTQAARLGKQALKDQRIMAMLWHKFKNQSKIAQFLGVNRSSVHRRFKMLNCAVDGKEQAA